MVFVESNINERNMTLMILFSIGKRHILSPFNILECSTSYSTIEGPLGVRIAVNE
jgi:hypothetical protein